MTRTKLLIGKCVPERSPQGMSFHCIFFSHESHTSLAHTIARQVLGLGYDCPQMCEMLAIKTPGCRSGSQTVLPGWEPGSEGGHYHQGDSVHTVLTLHLLDICEVWRRAKSRGLWVALAHGADDTEQFWNLSMAGGLLSAPSNASKNTCKVWDILYFGNMSHGSQIVIIARNSSWSLLSFEFFWRNVKREILDLSLTSNKKSFW